MKKLIVLTILTLTILLAAPSTALADDTFCVGALPPGTYDNVIVPPGQGCAIFDSTVRGSIKALENSILFSGQNIVRGDIEGDEADYVALFDGTVGGNVLIKGADASFGSITVFGITLTGGNIEIEKSNVNLIDVVANILSRGSITVKENVTQSLVVRSNTVGQNLRVEKNDARSDLFIIGNDVGQNLRVEKNTVDQSILIKSNEVAQNLQVFKNRGPALKFVQDNTVGENLQCRGNDPPFVGAPNAARHSEGQCGAPPAP